jgi:hypothetical protein
MDKVFKHVLKHPDVWVATYAENAQWVAANKFVADPRRLLRA